MRWGSQPPSHQSPAPWRWSEACCSGDQNPAHPRPTPSHGHRTSISSRLGHKLLTALLRGRAPNCKQQKSTVAQLNTKLHRSVHTNPKTPGESDLGDGGQNPATEPFREVLCYRHQVQTLGPVPPRLQAAGHEHPGTRKRVFKSP